MKKLVLLLVVLLVALPVAALALETTCPTPPTPEPEACTSIFQAYGDYAGSYSVGCQTISGCYESSSSSSTKVDCLANACPTQYGDSVAANCNGGGQTCVLNVTVRERNSSSISDGKFNSQLAVGSASGQIFGSASVCGDPRNFSSDTGFNQTLTTYSQASFDPCDRSACAAVSGSGFASGSQTFIAAPR
jgi:hypothetical protein